MPIRHCQKCGLKVLIDESQTTANPFYCQRCTSSMKTDTASLPKEEAAAAPAPAPAAPKKDTSMSLKPASVKVKCPYCDATFNGRIPQKPAKGACPICQKELILLPNGDIQAATQFDLAAWQQRK